MQCVGFAAEAGKHAAMEESEAMHEDATGVTFQAFGGLVSACA